MSKKHGLCRSHYRQVSPLDVSLKRASEQMLVMHRLGRKHTREVQRLARAAGLRLVKKPSYYEQERAAS